MDIIQAHWRGKQLSHKKDSGGAYATMMGVQSLLYFPVIILENSAYKITIEARKDSGNGIVSCNIYGNRNYDFPQMLLCCNNSEWEVYSFEIKTGSFPKTLPFMFRLWRSPKSTGNLSIRHIVVERLETGDTSLLNKQEQIFHANQNSTDQNNIQELYSNIGRDNDINNTSVSLLDDELEPHVRRFSHIEQHTIKVLFFAYSYSEIEKNQFGFLGVNQLGLIDAFVDNGYDICTFFYNQYFEKFGFKKTQEAIIYLAEFYEPDLIFMQFQDFSCMVSVNTVNEMMRVCPQAFTINTSVDIRNATIPFMVEVGKLVHKTLIPSVGQIQMYKDDGCIDVSFWRQGYDPKYFYRENDKKRADLYKKYRHDISFCAHRPNWGDFPDAPLRRDIASVLSKVFGNRFGLYGVGWDLIKDEICEESFRRYAGFYETNDIYNGSKLVISVNQINNVEKYWSNRQIIAMASGTATVSRYVPGMEEYFTNGKDILWFKTVEECIDLCKYYLLHNKEAKQIGCAGAKIVKENFSYYSTVKDLVKIFPENLVLWSSLKSQIFLMYKNKLESHGFDEIKNLVQNIKSNPKLTELQKTKLLQQVLAGFCITDKEYILCHRS